MPRYLSSPTAEDLKDLGVNLVGHRRRRLDGAVGVADFGDWRRQPGLVGRFFSTW
jgi:hypothetical protein